MHIAPACSSPARPSAGAQLGSGEQLGSLSTCHCPGEGAPSLPVSSPAAHCPPDGRAGAMLKIQPRLTTGKVGCSSLLPELRGPLPELEDAQGPGYKGQLLKPPLGERVKVAAGQLRRQEGTTRSVGGRNGSKDGFTRVGRYEGGTQPANMEHALDPILQTRNRLRVVKQRSQSHTAGKYQSQDLNPGHLAVECLCVPVILDLL